jgi:hypothetical protein
MSKGFSRRDLFWGILAAMPAWPVPLRPRQRVSGRRPRPGQPLADGLYSMNYSCAFPDNPRRVTITVYDARSHPARTRTGPEAARGLNRYEID